MVKKPWNYNKFSEHIPAFIKYKRIVNRLTNKVVNLIPGYNKSKRGRAGIRGAYQVDHIITIKHGFLNGIPHKVIANISNLQFITWEDNLKRRMHNSLNIEATK